MALKTVYQVEIKGIPVGIKKTGDLKRAIKLVEEEFKKSEFGSEKFRKLQKTMGQLKGVQAELRKSTRETKKDLELRDLDPTSLRALQIRYGQLRGEVLALSAAERKRPFGKQLIADAARTQLAIRKLDKEMNDFRSNVGNYSSALGGLAGSFKNLALTFGVGFGISELARAATRGIRTFADFDQQIATLGAISGSTEKELARLREQAIAVGSSTQFTALQVAELQTELARLGFSAAEITQSTEAVGNIAIATGEDIGKSAKVIGQSIRAYGLEAGDAARVADVLTASFNSSGLQLETFSEASKLLAPVSRTLGISIEESTAAIGLLADNGLEGTIATQTLGSALQRLADPAKSNAKALDALGIRFFDGQGKFKGLAESLSLFDEATKNFTPEDRLAQISQVFGVNAAKNFAILLEGTKEVNGEILRGADAIRGYTGVLEGAQGAAEDTAGKVGDTLAQDFLKLRSAVEGAAIRLVEARNDGLRGMVQAVTEAVPKIGRLVGLVGDALLNALKFIGQPLADLGESFRSLSAAFDSVFGKGSAVKTILEVLTFTTKAAFTPLRVLLNAYSLIVAVIAEAVANTKALINIIDRNTTVFDGLRRFIDANVTAFGNLKETVAGVISGIGGATEGLGGFIGRALKFIPQLDLIAKAFRSVRDGIFALSDAIGEERARIADAEVSALKNTIDRLNEEIRQIAEGERFGNLEEKISELRKAQQKYNELTGEGIPVTEEYTESTDRLADAADRYAGAAEGAANGAKKQKAEAEAAKGSIEALERAVSILEDKISKSDITPELLDTLNAQLVEAREKLADARFELNELGRVQVELPPLKAAGPSGEQLRKALDLDKLRLEIESQKPIKLPLNLSDNAKEIQKAFIDIEVERKEAILDSEVDTQEEIDAINRDFDIRRLSAKLQYLNLEKEERIAVEDEIAELQRQKDEERLARIKGIVEFAGGIVNEVTGLVGDFLDQQSEKRLAGIEERRERELETAGGNAAAEEEINKKFDKEREKEEKKAAKQRKAIAITESIIATALAVVRALPNIPLSILAGITGAANTALIASQKFSHGGLLPDGILEGPPHSAGGVKFTHGGRLMEAEGGEAIINRKSTKKYRPLLSAINAAEGGRRFDLGGIVELNRNFDRSMAEKYGGLFREGGVVGGFTPNLAAIGRDSLRRQGVDVEVRVANSLKLSDSDIERIADAVREGSMEGSKQGSKEGVQEEVTGIKEISQINNESE